MGLTEQPSQIIALRAIIALPSQRSSWARAANPVKYTGEPAMLATGSHRPPINQAPNMGMDLTNDIGEAARFNGYAWAIMLNLAQQYGWRPLGTASPMGWNDTTVWTNRYDTNEGQYVLLEDARAIADALDTAVSDSALGDSLTAIDVALHQEILGVTGVSTGTGAVDLGIWRETLVEFARFCRQGGFRID